MHTVAAVTGYLKKQLGKPVTILTRKQDVTSFIINRNSPDHALSTVVVVRIDSKSRKNDIFWMMLTFCFTCSFLFIEILLNLIALVTALI